MVLKFHQRKPNFLVAETICKGSRKFLDENISRILFELTFVFMFLWYFKINWASSLLYYIIYWKVSNRKSFTLLDIYTYFEAFLLLKLDVLVIGWGGHLSVKLQLLLYLVNELLDYWQQPKRHQCLSRGICVLIVLCQFNSDIPYINS